MANQVSWLSTNQDTNSWHMLAISGNVHSTILGHIHACPWLLLTFRQVKAVILDVLGFYTLFVVDCMVQAHISSVIFAIPCIYY